MYLTKMNLSHYNNKSICKLGSVAYRHVVLSLFAFFSLGTLFKHIYMTYIAAHIGTNAITS